MTEDVGLRHLRILAWRSGEANAAFQVLERDLDIPFRTPLIS
jgi:hypothetical protein